MRCPATFSGLQKTRPLQAQLPLGVLVLRLALRNSNRCLVEGQILDKAHHCLQEAVERAIRGQLGSASDHNQQLATIKALASVSGSRQKQAAPRLRILPDHFLASQPQIKHPRQRPPVRLRLQASSVVPAIPGETDYLELQALRRQPPVNQVGVSPSPTSQQHLPDHRRLQAMEEVPQAASALTNLNNSLPMLSEPKRRQRCQRKKRQQRQCPQICLVAYHSHLLEASSDPASQRPTMPPPQLLPLHRICFPVPMQALEQVFST